MRSIVRSIRKAAFGALLISIVVATGFALFPMRLLGRLSARRARRPTRWLQRVWTRAVLGTARATLGFSLRVEGPPIVGPGPFVIVSNHQSILDIPLLIAALGRFNPAFVVKESLRVGTPNISPAGRLTGCAFISRKKGDERQLAEIRALGERTAADAHAAAIFPEGTRSKDGSLGVFKAGGIGALLEGAPRARVVAVAIDGTSKARSLDQFLGLIVRVRVGEPFSLEATDPAERAREAAARCRGFVEAAQAEWRSRGSTAR